MRTTTDIVFTRAKVAVYVDGCFWHSCPDHGTMPAANRDWWQKKLDRNKTRDRQTDEALVAAGWAVVRVWEHEDTMVAADRVERALRGRKGQKRRFPPSIR